MQRDAAISDAAASSKALEDMSASAAAAQRLLRDHVAELEAELSIARQQLLEAADAMEKERQGAQRVESETALRMRAELSVVCDNSAHRAQRNRQRRRLRRCA